MRKPEFFLRALLPDTLLKPDSLLAGLTPDTLLAAHFAPEEGIILFVSSTNTKSVLAYDGETGEFLGKFARGGGLIEPEGIAFGPDGDLFVASRSNEILRYDGEKGNFEGVFASGHGLGRPCRHRLWRTR